MGVNEIDEIKRLKKDYEKQKEINKEYVDECEELKRKLDEVNKAIEITFLQKTFAENENALLKEQIEKMKCCSNCLYQYCIDTDEPCCKCKINLESKIKEDKWELA